uniref:Uncharacterized protein n=1 Tax=Oryza brachyantha TaxID=4533 RepID=J3MS25_ORYBR
MAPSKQKLSRWEGDSELLAQTGTGGGVEKVGAWQDEDDDGNVGLLEIGGGGEVGLDRAGRDNKH